MKTGSRKMIECSSFTVIGQSPGQNISCILADTLANVTSMFVDLVGTFIS